MKRTLYIIVALMIGGLWGGGFALADDLRYFSAPSELPGVSREMKTPGFWISRHPAPDKVIMGPWAIDKLNASLRRMKVVSDLAEFPLVLDGIKWQEEIRGIIRGFKKRTLFERSGREAGAAFYQKVEQEADLASLPKAIEARFGFVTASADERLLPGADPLYAKAGDADFDEAQNSALSVGEPVLILHKSQSGQWLFVKDALAAGWVEASRVAFAPRDEVVSYLRRKTLVLVTEPKTDIYWDRDMRQYGATVRMGTRFVLKNPFGRAVEVLLPQRQDNGSLVWASGFVAREDISFGALPFTPRTIYRQAFKMLHAPYGWGDMYGEQDCSRFLQMVFATVGIMLPRNSAEQGKVGDVIPGFAEDLPTQEKRDVIAQGGTGAQTFLKMKGHIALYLGQVDGVPYAIHETWAYREPSPQGDVVRRVNQVAVSSLDLGEGSAKGSLLRRINSARTLR